MIEQKADPVWGSVSGVLKEKSGGLCVLAESPEFSYNLGKSL